MANIIQSKPSLKLIKDLCEENRDLGYLYRIQAELFETISSKTEEETNLNNAIVYARKSVQISQHSIEFGWYLASLLFKAAKDSDGLQQVVQECETALAITKPIDPVEERWLGETPEDRINSVRQYLTDLMDCCKFVLVKGIASAYCQSKPRLEHQNVVKRSDAIEHVPIEPAKEKLNLHQVPVDSAADDLMAEKEDQAKSEKTILESFDIRMVTEIYSVYEVVDEIRRISGSLPPRPADGEIKEAYDAIRKIEEKEQLLLKAISRPSQEVPDEQTRMSLVSYQIQKERREARTNLAKLLSLEILHAETD